MLGRGRPPGPVQSVCSPRCEDERVVGFEFTRLSLIISLMALFLVFVCGALVSCGMGKYSAFMLERRAIIQRIRRRRREEREVSKRFQEQLSDYIQNEVKECGAHQQMAEDEEEKVLCVVCYVREVDVAIGPCGHVAVCKPCCLRLKECPVCRECVKQVYSLPKYLVDRLSQVASGVDSTPNSVPEPVVVPVNEERS